MNQDTLPERDLHAEYWATYHRQWSVVEDYEREQARKNMAEKDVFYAELYRLAADPWTNGRYALAAVAWGLIALVVLGVGAGP
jgi:hypothetical protein